MRRCLALLAICAIACVGVSADVIFSNFGTGDSFNLSMAWTLTGPASAIGTEYDQAMAFTPGADYFLDQVDVAIRNVQDDDQVDVMITDDNGGIPGTILEQTSVIAPGTAGVVTATFAGTTQLSSGQQYWLWLSAYDDGYSAWNWNDQGDTALKAQSMDLSSGGSWSPSIGNTRGAYRVEGTLVPEPGTFVLLGLGAVGLVLYRRRKQS